VVTNYWQDNYLLYYSCVYFVNKIFNTTATQQSTQPPRAHTHRQVYKELTILVIEQKYIMSWLFSRRNDEDSDEWTDASDSEDEYTDASESDEELKETTIIENGDDETIDKNGKEIFTDDLSKNDPSEPNEPAAAAAAAANAAANAENPPPPPSTTTTVVDTEKNPAEKNIDNSAAEIVASSDDTAVVTSERNTESTDEIQEISPLTTDNDAGESTDDNRTSSLVDESGEQTSEKKLLELDQQSQLEFRESEKNGPEVEQHDSESQKGQQDAGDAGTETPSENEKEQRTAATGNEEETTNAEVEKEEEKEEDEEVTSMHEKRSLLLLAAEHDRVDILNAILADDSESRVMLLNSGIPPLHISIAFGSTNAVQSLLRMGADPSIRPDVNAIKNEFEAQGEEQLVDIPNMGRFDNLTAWELAFGKANAEKTNPKKSGWFGGGVKRGLDIAPSKLETIRMGFTAEALRSIGSDEVDRLKQLLDSGMPATIDIGGKNLYDWSVEMGALQCEELLRPEEAARSESFAAPAGDATSEQQANVQDGTRKEAASAVLDRSKPGEESLSSLVNRIDELESLSKALSSCLDNLAEEVSVCHGLLLMGGGASALASHVRSLKTLKENKIVELQHLEEAWEFSEDELAYWVKESGEQGREVAELMSPAIIPKVNEETTPKRTVEEEQAHKQQLKANAALLENKVRVS